LQSYVRVRKNFFLYFVVFHRKCLFAVNDQGDAKFSKFGVSPPTGNRGTKFLLDCSFITKNGTGTGTFRILVVDPNKSIRSNVFWFEAKKAGSYIERIAIDTIEQTCDPALGNSC
jgi:hypothetical protein